MAVLQIGPCNAVPNAQVLGGTVYISCDFRSLAGVLTNPGTSITIEIVNVDGSIHTAYTAMTNSSTGTYYYLFASGTDESPGAYSVRVKSVDGGVTSIQAFTNVFWLTGLA